MPAGLTFCTCASGLSLYSSPFFSSACLAYVGMWSEPDPGRGSAGDPFILAMSSEDHLWSGGLLMTPPTLKTALLVATMFSPVLMVMPNHTPFSNLSSKSPTRFLVWGILNITVSPNGSSGRFVFCPFILCIAVLPQGNTLHLVST